MAETLEFFGGDQDLAQFGLPDPVLAGPRLPVFSGSGNRREAADPSRGVQASRVWRTRQM